MENGSRNEARLVAMLKDQVLQHPDKSAATDMALANLLVSQVKHFYLDTDLASFAKSFRQINVTPDPRIDLAIWHLLNGLHVDVKRTWNVLCEFFDENEDQQT